MRIERSIITSNFCRYICGCTGLSRYICASTKEPSSLLNLNSLSPDLKAIIKALLISDNIKITEAIEEIIYQANSYVTSLILHRKNRISKKIQSFSDFKYDRQDLAKLISTKQSIISLLLRARERITLAKRWMQNEKLSDKDADIVANILKGIIKGFEFQRILASRTQNLRFAASMALNQERSLKLSEDDIENRIMRYQRRSVLMERQNPQSKVATITAINRDESQNLRHSMFNEKVERYQELFLSNSRSQTFRKKEKNSDFDDEFIITIILGPGMIGEYTPVYNTVKKIKIEPRMPLQEYVCIANCTGKNIIYIESGFNNTGSYTSQVLHINLISKCIVYLQKPESIMVNCGLPVCFDKFIYTFGGSNGKEA
jgi:hypothetical protein